MDERITEITIAPSKLHNDISSRSKPLVEVHWEELEWRGELTDSKIYIIGTDTPFTGISHRFHPNGMKSCQTSWKDGKRHGLSRGWHSNGLKSQEGLRLNDKRVGLWIYWYDNGQELYEKHYRNGKLDGSWVTWYQNGQMKQESSWKNGKQHAKQLAVLMSECSLCSTYSRDWSALRTSDIICFRGQNSED